MALHEKLTSLAKDAATKANSLAKDAASKANTAIENGKLSLKINNEEKKIDEFTLNIGELILDQLDGGETFDDEIMALYSSIQAARDVITAARADIEANRKADASFKVGEIEKGSKVRVEQISHEFFFGAHIFNFDQLGDKTLNAKYRSLFGTLFNSATVAFYWDKFEMQAGRPRDRGEFWASRRPSLPSCRSR